MSLAKVMSEKSPQYRLEQRGEIAGIHFDAMASPCEVLLVGTDAHVIRQAASMAAAEAERIEQKFSRYLPDSIVHQINCASGARVAIDPETFALLQLAGRCFALSEGKFDITAGILRRAWRFDGGDIEPDQQLIDTLRTKIGWEKVRLSESDVQMPGGMEIDLGGIGKEYAVDRVADMLFTEFHLPVLVNFGGDVRAVSPVKRSYVWTVGIENPQAVVVGNDSSPARLLSDGIEISNGGIATSGDSRRFCRYRGQRLSHILDPRTGWPVENAPRSVTVVGLTCLEAGLFATLGMLAGDAAERFLEREQVANLVVR